MIGVIRMVFTVWLVIVCIFGLICITFVAYLIIKDIKEDIETRKERRKERSKFER